MSSPRSGKRSPSDRPPSGEGDGSDNTTPREGSPTPAQSAQLETRPPAAPQSTPCSQLLSRSIEETLRERLLETMRNFRPGQSASVSSSGGDTEQGWQLPYVTCEETAPNEAVASTSGLAQAATASTDRSPIKSASISSPMSSISEDIPDPPPRAFRLDELSYEDRRSVKILQEYLRIPTCYPYVNFEVYEICEKFLRRIIMDAGLAVQMSYFDDKKLMPLITIKGSKPELPAILLTSHVDVPRIDKRRWKHSPFDAVIDDDGNIFARGAQNTKTNAIQYLEAIRRLKLDDVALVRTIHILFIPDDGVDESEAMAKVTESYLFQKLHIGIAFNGGVVSDTEDFYIVHGEKATWQISIHCSGTTAHASLLGEDTAGEKMCVIINRMLEFRDSEKQKLKDNPNLTIADVVSLNLTRLTGGLDSSVTPSEFIATFDVRFPPKYDDASFQMRLKHWTAEAGANVVVIYELKQPNLPETPITENFFYWRMVTEAMDELKLKLSPMVACSTGDAQYLRSVGIPVYGFSPINFTNERRHGDNEFLNVKTYLKGIEIYYNILKKIGTKVSDEERDMYY